MYIYICQWIVLPRHATVDSIEPALALCLFCQRFTFHLMVMMVMIRNTNTITMMVILTMTAGIAVNSNYKERHTQYSQLANRLKMTKTSLSLGSVLEVPGAWGLFGDVWRCVLWNMLKLLIFWLSQNLWWTAQPSRPGEEIMLELGSRMAKLWQTCRSCKMHAQISLVWLTFGLCLDYWLVFTPPTSHYISYIHVGWSVS